MLAVIFIVSCLSVFGFYAYVLVHLRREERGEDAHKKRLPAHFYETYLSPYSRGRATRRAWREKFLTR